MFGFGFTATATFAFLLCYGLFLWLRNQRKKCFDAFEGTGIPGPPVRSLINGNADEFWYPSQLESLGRWLKEYGDVFGRLVLDAPSSAGTIMLGALAYDEEGASGCNMYGTLAQFNPDQLPTSVITVNRGQAVRGTITGSAALVVSAQHQDVLIGDWRDAWCDVTRGGTAAQHAEWFYIGDTPFVVTKDVDMIKTFFATDFSNYSGRGHIMHIHELHPLLDQNLVFVKGAHWKAARACMAQFFTTAKLKTVMPSVHDAMRQLFEVLGEYVDRGEEVDINTYCERFTFDVISKAAFSIDTGVQRNPDHPLFQACLATFPNFMKGFFYRMGQNLYHWPWFIKAFPKLLDLLYHNPLAHGTSKSIDIIKFRYENPQVKLSDMAQLLLDDALGKKEGAFKKDETTAQIPASLTREKMIELATNSMDIFLGGYDTSRLALTYWFFLMGKHPDVQEKMRKEILEAYKNEGEYLSMQTVTSLQYTSQVINETLRMYPPIVTFTTRRADEDHRCGKYLIKRGTSVMVPTYHLHRDPQFWTDPEKFDPDRFSPENKDLINPVAYQPFGYGVRKCIGMRLAMLELASVTSQVLRRYRIELGANQKRDLELYTYSFLAAPKEKVWIRLHRFNGVK